MKKLKDVEAVRKQYHRDPTLNSVHRSSLMVPELPETKVDISFLNHFLLKRNHQMVACKITAIDFEGQKIESRLHMIDKPIVYTITLTGMVEKPVSTYMVEFFASNNLFIPFPAVMINHHGKDFVNQVHAYNRVLNDIFEDNEINAHQVKEASVDLPLQKDVDTFLLFSAGPLPCKETFEIEITTKENVYKKTYELNIPRFGIQKISMKDTFPNLPEGEGGIIKAMQPRQLLFYGRMLCGQSTKNGSFSANHSYYDSSTTKEYWNDTRPSGRLYPFFKELSNIIRLYPIMSPSDLQVFITLYDNDGLFLNEYQVGELKSPSNNYLDVNINSVVKNENLELEKISTFGVIAKINSGKMPTRIGHQLVYGTGGLNSSIAVSLFNPNIFNPKDKKSFKWGQIITGLDFDSSVGIVSDSYENSDIDIHDSSVKFYNEDGLFLEKKWKLKNNTAIKFQTSELLNSKTNSSKKSPEYIWCTIDSDHYGLNFFSIAYNKISRHASGDHGF